MKLHDNNIPFVSMNFTTSVRPVCFQAVKCPQRGFVSWFPFDFSPVSVWIRTRTGTTEKLGQL
jgi:hypothetical protein